jgi:predicted dehydrogenase
MPLFFACNDPDRARDYCHRYGGAGWFGSWESALANARSSIAILATPPPTRFQLTFQALAAGMHVIVEPPAFGRSSEVELVSCAARTAGRRVMVAESSFYRPLSSALRRIINQRTLGEVRLVHLDALRATPGDGRQGERPDTDRRAGLHDGLHWISFLANLGLPALKLGWQAAGRLHDVNRTWLISLEYANGAVGQLWYSAEIPSRRSRLRLSTIYGTAGTAVFPANGLFILESGRRRRLTLPSMDDRRGYNAMFADFLAAMHADRDPAYTLDHARRDLALLEPMRGAVRERS